MKVGAELQKARLQKGLSLEDVAHRTRIPVVRLAALERDDIASFGSLTYGRAFLAQYARYLEVDVSPVLKELPGGMLGGASDYRYLTQSFGPWVDRRQRLGKRRSPRNGSAGHGTQRGPGTSAVVLFGVLLLGTGIFAKHMLDDAGKVLEQAPTAEIDPVTEASHAEALVRSEVSTAFDVPGLESTVAKAIVVGSEIPKPRSTGPALRPTEIIED